MNLLFGLEKGHFSYYSQIGELLRALEEFGATVSYAWIELPYGKDHSVRIENGKTVWYGQQALGSPHFFIQIGQDSIFMNENQITLALKYIQGKNLRLDGELEFWAEIHNGIRVAHVVRVKFETGQPITIEQEVKYDEQR